MSSFGILRSIISSTTLHLKDDLFQVSWPSGSSCQIICLFSIRLSYHAMAGAFQIANSEQNPFRTKDLETGWVLWHPATPSEVLGAEALVPPGSLSKMQNLRFHPTPSPKWLNKNMHFNPQFMSVPTRCKKLFSEMRKKSKVTQDQLGGGTPTGGLWPGFHCRQEHLGSSTGTQCCDWTTGPQGPWLGRMY